MQRKLSALPAGVIEILRDQDLFSDIADNVLTSCLSRVEELHILKDELIFRKGESYHKGIYIILSGGIKMLGAKQEVSLAGGDILGVTTFLGKTMYSVTAVAEYDSSILFVDEYSIYSLMEKAPGFREKFMTLVVQRLNVLERLSAKTLALSPSQSVASCMSSPLFTLHNSKSISDAAKLMKEHDVGALVIMNRKHVLKGLLTAKDLTHKYLTNPTESPDKALAEDYANPEPLILPPEYPLMEAYAEMFRLGVEYALVTRKNKLAGIISKTDVMVLLSKGSDIFGASVARASNFDELKAVTGNLSKILENVMYNTSLFRDILPTLSSNHLVIQKRAFELTLEQYRKDGHTSLFLSNFCVVTLGSLARRGMTLEMTQDHAVVIMDETSEKDMDLYREFFKDFAHNLNHIGYLYHPLGMSLDNPDMIKRISEWGEYVSLSIHKSTEESIPRTRILFDCEKLEGNEGLLWDLKDKIHATLKEKSLFFGRLINYQSIFKIPISQFGSFITEKDGDDEGTIDLKESALSFIIYTAQAFALYNGLFDVSTVRRLEHLARKNALSQEMISEVISAYESVVDLVLHEQLGQVKAGERPSFKIKPFSLSMHDQEKLKRALHIIARFFGEGLAYFK